MIRSITERDAAGVKRQVQIVCDRCSATSLAMVVTPGTAPTEDALTEAALALGALRAKTGFTEHGRRGWTGGAAPQGIGDEHLIDLCARCAEQPGGLTR